MSDTVAQLVADLVAAWNAHNADRVSAFYAAEYEGRDVGEAVPRHGPQGARETLARYLGAFPDIYFSTDETIAQGNRVALAWTLAPAASRRLPPVREPTDEALLRGLGGRDTGALEALYDRHHQVALGLAWRLLRNRELAEDVVQEAFLSVWRQAGTYRPERGSVRNWLLSIVHHRAVDRLRRDVAPAALEESLPDTEHAEVWEQAAQHILC